MRSLEALSSAVSEIRKHPQLFMSGADSSHSIVTTWREAATYITEVLEVTLRDANQNVEIGLSNSGRLFALLPQ